MEDIDLDPIQVLRWALEKVSPADVVGSSARESFQKFVRRGTVPQLRLLLLEVQELGIPPAISETRENAIKRRRCLSDASTASFRSPRKQASCNRRMYRMTPSDTQSLSPALSPSQSVALSSLEVTNFSESPQSIQGHLSNLSSQCSSPSSNCSTIDVACSPSCLTNVQPPDVLLEAKRYFAARLGDRCCRLSHLVRAVQGFIEAPPLTPDFAQNMWNARSSIFDKPTKVDKNARLRSLYDGHRKIKGAREQYSYAARFSYIYLEHDLEELSKSEFLVLSQGRGKMTAAFELQAEIISTTVEVVKAERKAGRGYLQLLMEGGPGFVLRLGRNVSTIWERKLSASDISLIIEFLKTQVPDLYSEIKAHDKAATCALLDGFMAYGWTAEEVIKSESFLFDKLRDYVNLEEILRVKSGREPLPTPAMSESGDMEPQSDQNQHDCNSIQEMSYLENRLFENSLAGFPVTSGDSSTTDFTRTDSHFENSLFQISDAQLELLLSVDMDCADIMESAVNTEDSGESSIWDVLGMELDHIDKECTMTIR